MAWVVQRVEGYDHQNTSIVGGGIFNTLVNAGITTSVFRTGTASLYFNAVANGANYVEHNLLTSAIKQVCVKGHFQVQDATPSTEYIIMDLYPTSGVRERLYLQTNGKLRFQNFSNSISMESASAIADNTWVAVELRAFVASDGKRTLRWRIDGGTEASVTETTAASTNTNYERVRPGGPDSGTGNPAFDLFWDDLVIWISTQTTEQSGWPTESSHNLSVYLHIPNADGTHVIGSGTWRNSSGTAITAGTTNAYTFVDDVVTPGTDYVEKLTGTGTTSTERLTINLQTESDAGASGTAKAVTGIVGIAEAASQAENTEIVLTDGTQTSTIYTGDIGNTSLTYKAFPASGGSGILSPNADTLQFYFGGTDADPDIRLHIAWAQVAYEPGAGGNTYTKSGYGRESA